MNYLKYLKYTPPGNIIATLTFISISETLREMGIDKLMPYDYYENCVPSDN